MHPSNGNMWGKMMMKPVDFWLAYLKTSFVVYYYYLISDILSLYTIILYNYVYIYIYIKYPFKVHVWLVISSHIHQVVLFCFRVIQLVDRPRPPRGTHRDGSWGSKNCCEIPCKWHGLSAGCRGFVSG